MSVNLSCSISTSIFFDLPDDIFLDSVFPFLKAAELGQIVSTNQRIHELCISSLIGWINEGNPIHELNEDAEQLIPFFAQQKVDGKIKWLNLEKLENYTILIQGCSNFEHLKVTGDDLRTVTASDLQCILAKKCSLKTLQILPSRFEAEAFPTLSRLVDANPGLSFLSLPSICCDKLRVLELTPALSQITGLQELDLGANKLCRNVKMVKWLASLLQANSQLRSLILHVNDLNDTRLNHLIPSLRTLQYLETLVLSNNKISIIGATILADALVNLPSFQNLNLDFNTMKLGEEKEFLRFANRLTRIQKLSVLSLNVCEIDLSKKETFASSLLEISNLTQLDLLSNYMSIATLTIFSKRLERSRLKFLGLSYNEIESQGLKILGSYFTNTPPCLTVLKIRIIPSSGPAGDTETQLLISGLAKQTFLTLMEFNCFPWDYAFFSETQINLIREALKMNHAEFVK